jgi:hypothetical protein
LPDLAEVASLWFNRARLRRPSGAVANNNGVNLESRVFYAADKTNVRAVVYFVN